MMERLREDPTFVLVGPAHEGEEALRLYELEGPNAALIDAVLPKINGIELLRAIRKSGSNCKVIVFSSHLNEPAIREQLQEAGADDLVEKSMGFEKVIELLSLHVQSLNRKK